MKFFEDIIKEEKTARSTSDIFRYRLNTFYPILLNSLQTIKKNK